METILRFVTYIRNFFLARKVARICTYLLSNYPSSIQKAQDVEAYKKMGYHRWGLNPIVLLDIDELTLYKSAKSLFDDDYPLLVMDGDKVLLKAFKGRPVEFHKGPWLGKIIKFYSDKGDKVSRRVDAFKPLEDENE